MAAEEHHGAVQAKDVKLVQAKDIRLSPLQEAVAGVGAGIISTCAMQPLDLLKVRFQVSNTSAQGILASLRAVASGPEGLRGLYRGLQPNIWGNASSWGFYFLWYTMIKSSMASSDPSVRLNAAEHLFASASSGVITAFLTNPLWVLKTRWTSGAQSYSGVIEGLTRIGREEGFRGLYKGTILALVGVSNGAIQFMTYEECVNRHSESDARRLKRLARDRQRRLRGDLTVVGENDNEPLSNLEYIVLSGSAKLLSTAITYPYQTVRSRLQNQKSEGDAYKGIRDCVRRTWRDEGIRAFYRGLWPSAVRVIPGTCTTFVVCALAASDRV